MLSLHLSHCGDIHHCLWAKTFFFLLMTRDLLLHYNTFSFESLPWWMRKTKQMANRDDSTESHFTQIQPPLIKQKRLWRTHTAPWLGAVASALNHILLQYAWEQQGVLWSTAQGWQAVLVRLAAPSCEPTLTPPADWAGVGLLDDCLDPLFTPGSHGKKMQKRRNS